MQPPRRCAAGRRRAKVPRKRRSLRPGPPATGLHRSPPCRRHGRRASGPNYGLWQGLDRLERALDLGIREREVLELAGEVRVVGTQIEVAMARKVEEDRQPAALLVGGHPPPPRRQSPPAPRRGSRWPPPARR